MAGRRPIPTENIITIEIGKGLADRNRLPLAMVLRFLSEFRSLMSSVGREIQMSEGASDPSGDFGLEIVATGRGDAFSKGSVKASIAITKNVDAGVRAAKTVITTLHTLNLPSRKPVQVSENVVIAVIGAATVKLLGILYVIATYLFPQRLTVVEQEPKGTGENPDIP